MYLRTQLPATLCWTDPGIPDRLFGQVTAEYFLFADARGSCCQGWCPLRRDGVLPLQRGFFFSALFPKARSTAVIGNCCMIHPLKPWRFLGTVSLWTRHPLTSHPNKKACCLRSLARLGSPSLL